MCECGVPMAKLVQLYRILNLLSLDVASGAVVSALFFARLMNVHVRPFGFVCLGLTVWIIYTADHLFDVWTIKIPASTARHKFHQDNFKLLRIVLLTMITVDLILTVFIETPVFHWGLGLTGIVCLYFIVQSKLKFVKEFVGALLYSAGILLPSWPVAEKPLSPLILLLMGQFLITALINLILFSWFDYQRDLQDRRESLVTFLGHRIGKFLLIGLFLVQGSITVYLRMHSQDPVVVMVFAMMNLVLVFIFWESNFFSLDDRYRYAGDAVFFFPLIYLVA